MTTPRCTIPDCTSPHYAKGRCRRHYEQWRDTTTEKPRCTIDGCTKPVKARGWCATHYRQWLRGDTPHPIATGQRPECTVDGCTATAVCRAMCGRHYQRWRRYGTTDLPPRREPAPKPQAALRQGPLPPPLRAVARHHRPETTLHHRRLHQARQGARLVRHPLPAVAPRRHAGPRRHRPAH